MSWRGALRPAGLADPARQAGLAGAKPDPGAVRGGQPGMSISGISQHSQDDAATTLVGDPRCWGSSWPMRVACSACSEIRLGLGWHGAQMGWHWQVVARG